METVYDLVIIGAGPAGLEAALQAKMRGLSYLLIEQDEAGSLIEKTMAEKKFLHVYGRNTATLKGALPFPDRLKGGELVALWKEAAKDLSFAPHTKVSGIKKENDLFLITTDAGAHRARTVLLSSGTFEKHRVLGVPGEEGNPKIFYALDYYQEYDDQRTLVVGGGNSALETALHLAPYNPVTLIIRKSHIAESVAQNNRDDLEKLRAEGKITVLFETTIERLTPEGAHIQTPDGAVELPYDLLFVHVGYVQPFEFLASLGIEIQGEKAVFDQTTFETNVPGLFIAGALTGADSVIESANQSYEIVNRITTP